MKQRNGFVSNSSSSSFVVAVDEGTGPVTCQITIDVDLSRYGEKLSTKQAVDDYIIDLYGYRSCNTVEKILQEEDGSYLEDKYASMVAAIEQGKVIYTGSFSDEDGDPVETLLCHQGLKQFENEKIVVIEGEGGY